MQSWDGDASDPLQGAAQNLVLYAVACTNVRCGGQYRSSELVGKEWDTSKDFTKSSSTNDWVGPSKNMVGDDSRRLPKVGIMRLIEWDWLGWNFWKRCRRNVADSALTSSLRHCRVRFSTLTFASVAVKKAWCKEPLVRSLPPYENGNYSGFMAAIVMVLSKLSICIIICERR